MLRSIRKEISYIASTIVTTINLVSALITQLFSNYIHFLLKTMDE